MPKISLIVPVYNCDKYIRKSLDSIVKQSFKDFELILVDDGSTDDSGKICEEYAKNDNRIIVIHKENGGAGSARNAGIDRATAPYIMFPDADDWLELDALEKVYNAVQLYKTDVILFGFISHVFSQSGERIQKIEFENQHLDDANDLHNKFLKLFEQGTIGYVWNSLYSTKIIKDNNIYFPNMRRYQDAMFNVYYYRHVDNCHVINDCLYNYKENEVNELYSKSPISIFELLIELAREFYSLIFNEWKLDTEENKRIISSFIINAIIAYLPNVYNPDWNLNKNQRLELLDNLLKNDIVVECLNNSKLRNRYLNEVKNLLKSKKLKSVLFLVRFRLFLKKYFIKLFYFIKDSFIERE